MWQEGGVAVCGPPRRGLMVWHWQFGTPRSRVGLVRESRSILFRVGVWNCVEEARALIRWWVVVFVLEGANVDEIS